MTDIQKRKIIQLRREGVGYMKIGQLVGLPTSTVRYFCQVSEDEIGKKEYCKQCGKKLVQREKVKTRLFCSDECRHKWWNAHPESVDRKTYSTFICECCGKEFRSYGKRERKYCSKDCYIKMRFKSDDEKD